MQGSTLGSTAAFLVSQSMANVCKTEDAAFDLDLSKFQTVWLS